MAPSDRVLPFPVTPTASLAQVQNALVSVAADAQGSGPLAGNLSSVTIDPSKAALSVGAVNPASAQTLLSQRYPGIPASVFYEAAEPAYPKISRTQNNGRIRAGDEIDHSGGTCTASFGANDSFVNSKGQTIWRHFVLTAGHCSGGAFYRHGEKIGAVTRSAYAGYGRVDAEAIKVDKDLMPHEIYKSHDNADPIRAAGSTYAGQSLCMSGITTGTHCGPVQFGGQPEFRSSDGEWFILVDTGINNGDSGSPVWDKRTGLSVGIAVEGQSTQNPDGSVKQPCPAVGYCPLMRATPLLPLGGTVGVKSALGGLNIWHQ